MEIKEKLDKLVMFLANSKDIPLDVAKRNRDAIMKQTIKNLKKELKEFDFNAENWKYSFGFNEGKDWNKLFVEIEPLNPTFCYHSPFGGETEIGSKYPELEYENIAKKLSSSVMDTFKRFIEENGEFQKKYINSIYFKNFVHNLPFGFDNLVLNIGDESYMLFEANEMELKFKFYETDVPKENIISLINLVVDGIGSFGKYFSKIRFEGEKYKIEVEYMQQCYAVIKTKGLSTEEEIEYLSLAGNTIDRVRFLGEHLQYDVTQSTLCENLVDIHFEQKGKIFDVIRNKTAKIDDENNPVIEYFRKNYPDWMWGILDDYGCKR